MQLYISKNLVLQLRAPRLPIAAQRKYLVGKF